MKRNRMGWKRTPSRLGVLGSSLIASLAAACFSEACSSSPSAAPVASTTPKGDIDASVQGLEAGSHIDSPVDAAAAPSRDGGSAAPSGDDGSAAPSGGPVLIASVLCSPTGGCSSYGGLAVDATSVYWVASPNAGFGTQVLKCSINGCMNDGPTVLYQYNNEGNAVQNYSELGFSIVVDSTSVYWNDAITNGVNKIPVGGVPDGGAPTVLTASWPNDNALMTMTMDATGENLYVGSSEVYGGIGKIPVNGGPSTLLSPLPTPLEQYPIAIAVDANDVYWINTENGTQNGIGDGTLQKLPLAGSPDAAAPTTVASDLADRPVTILNSSGPSALAYRGLVVDDANAYWCDFWNGVIFECALTGCGSQPTGVAAATYPTSVAADDVNLYWSDEDGIWKCAKSGCDKKPTMVVRTASPSTSALNYAVALDADNVYWIHELGSALEIWKAPKG